MLEIEVAFATPNLQKVVKLSVDSSISVIDAIKQSAIASFFPEYDFTAPAVGVFGKRIYDFDSYNIKNGDRIEIYRPLTKTPNQKRLDRAKTK